jgi:hypothetical protein
MHLVPSSAAPAAPLRSGEPIEVVTKIAVNFKLAE